jgi:tetratricopeptide (TPR) repeat protein
LALDRNLARAHALIGLAKLFLGRGEETEPHVNEAFRLSPRDTFASEWLIYVGIAKAQFGADAEAVSWMRRGLDANRNYSIAHFHLGAALARLGELEQARTAVQAGLALDPNFTIHRFRTYAPRANPIFLASHERLIEGMRLAGVPEG